jgi:gamma-glutamylcyclotransferase (GGCT)/AIG2-like uncharacterized protein YtfP
MRTPSLYFAYGSNLSTSHRTKRGCPDGLRARGIGWLPDRRLAFARRSRTWDGGVLSVITMPGAVVPGVVFEVENPEVLTWLDEKEGVGSGAYRRLETTALTMNGEGLRVVTYEVVEPSPFVPPDDAYTDVVRSGYSEYELDLAPLEAAISNGAPEVVAGLFVYGTLLRGEGRGDVIAAAKPDCVLLADAPGQLFDCGRFPAMRPPLADGQGRVCGEFVRFEPDAITSVLARLDDIEGFGGWQAETSLYDRRLLEVEVGDGRRRTAWTYIMDTPPADGQPISSGDWRAHRGTRINAFECIVAGHCERTTPEEFALAVARRRPMVSSVEAETLARELLPLTRALAEGRVTERELAFVSKRWAVAI